MFLFLYSPLPYTDPLNCNLTSVWVLVLRDGLQQFAYAAELAGLRWSIGNAKYGLSVSSIDWRQCTNVLKPYAINTHYCNA